MIEMGKSVIPGFHLIKFFQIYHFANYSSNIEHKNNIGVNGIFSIYYSEYLSLFLFIIRIIYIFIG